MLGRERYADASSDMERCRLEHDGSFERRGNPLRYGRRLDEITLFEDDGELITTEASDDIFGPNDLVQTRSDLLEHGIPGGVTKGVVDLLEVVQVDHEQGKPLERRIRTERVQATIEFVQQVTSIPEARQFVRNGLFLTSRREAGQP